MPREGYKSVTLNREILAMLSEIKEQLKAKVPIADFRDSQIINSALEYYLKFLQK
ncbi:MAG: hypothetical protein QG670_1707 [Thermoproteota archaeon]|nr:hypothetical protein [Thermoproteota archaeon]